MKLVAESKSGGFVGTLNDDATAAAFALGARDSNLPERNLFWVVHLIGAFEGPTANDNDADTETGEFSRYVNIGPESGFIWNEVIRDVAAEHSWAAEQITKAKQIAAIHVVGRQLGLARVDSANPSDVMGSYNTGAQQELSFWNIPMSFKESDIAFLRSIPGGI